MKTLILFFILTAAANFTNAQNAPSLLTPKSALPYSTTPKPWAPVTLDSVLKFKPGQKTLAAAPIKKDDAIVFYSRMPVAKLNKGNSRMPVLDLNKSDTHFNMPVARIDIVNPDTVGVEKVIP